MPYQTRIPNGDTALDLAQYIGRLAYYWVEGLEFQVEIIDARMNWGRVLYLIRPIAGEGSRWITDSHLTLKGRKPS